MLLNIFKRFSHPYQSIIAIGPQKSLVLRYLCGGRRLDSGSEIGLLVLRRRPCLRCVGVFCSEKSPILPQLFCSGFAPVLGHGIYLSLKKWTRIRERIQSKAVALLLCC